MHAGMSMYPYICMYAFMLIEASPMHTRTNNFTQSTYMDIPDDATEAEIRVAEERAAFTKHYQWSVHIYARTL